MKTLFKYVKASQFFATYAPGVARYKHKIRKLDGKDKPIDFTDSDKKAIAKGVKKLFTDIGKDL